MPVKKRLSIITTSFLLVSKTKKTLYACILELTDINRRVQNRYALFFIY